MKVSRLLAYAQIGLSVLIMLGYITGLFLKLIPDDQRHDLFTVVMLVAVFWFQRQRAHSDDDPVDPPVNPIQPVNPAKP